MTTVTTVGQLREELERFGKDAYLNPSLEIGGVSPATECCVSGYRGVPSAIVSEAKIGSIRMLIHRDYDLTKLEFVKKLKEIIA